MLQYSTPILLLIFNRPKLALQVIDSIRKQKPKYLFIAADGPRPLVEGDLDKCKLTRELVLNSIDWDCNVKTFLRDSNVGCGKAVSEAITWFFEHVEEGIILEDDCLPNDSFYLFCEELLRKFKDDKRVSAISGNNFLPHQPMPIDSDYYFSVFPSSWGWATWRRAWNGYDLHITSWNSATGAAKTRFIFNEKKYQLWWKNQFDYFHNGKIEHTWDFQFHYLSMIRKQLAIIPKANLVCNIGHGPDSTHFLDTESTLANLPTYAIDFPIKHPSSIARNYEADIYNQKLLFGEVEIVSPLKRVKRLMKQIIGRKIYR